MLAYSSNVGTIRIADQLGAREAVRVPAQVRARRSRPARGCPARRRAWCQPPDELERLGVRVGPDRAQRRRHAAADGGRRTRRSPTTASGCSRTWSGRPSRPDGTAHPGASRRRPAGCSARRTPAALRTMLEAVGHGPRAPPAAGRRPRLPGGRQDRHRLAGRSTAGTRRARSPRSSAWRRRTSPRYVIAVFAHTPERRRRRRRRAGVQRDDGVHPAALPGAADRHARRRSSWSIRADQAERDIIGGCGRTTGTAVRADPPTG